MKYNLNIRYKFNVGEKYMFNKIQDAIRVQFNQLYLNYLIGPKNISLETLQIRTRSQTH